MAHPIEYKPEYCERLTQHLADGLSFRAFAGEIGVCFKTLYNWEKKYPKFKAARDAGEPRNLLFWEKMGRAIATGQLEKANVTAWIFSMKNRHAWRDRVEQEISLKPPIFEIKTSKGETHTIKHEE